MIVRITQARPCVLVGLAVLFSFSGFAVRPGWTSDTQLSRATLQGLPGVSVLVEQLTPDVEQAGLTKKRLQYDIEGRLRRAGMRLLTNEAELHVRGAPHVYVRVNVLLDASGLAAYNIQVALRQTASLETATARAVVSTWEVSTLGIVGSNKLRTVRDSVRDLIDQFVDAYRSVNPRRAASSPTRRGLIRHVQERLQEGGFNPGTIDDILGPETREALHRFQSTHGLHPTGELDDATVDALGVR